jgi:glycosyltransferase involved in cell wall biosynthesis
MYTMGESVIYFVTDVTVANKFGLEQIRYLSNSNLKIHLVCGQGYLSPEFLKVCDSITQLDSLKRPIEIFSDIKTFLLIAILIYKIKPTCVIYSTPKASLIGALSSYLLGVKNRIYQIWGARWETLSGIDLLVVRNLDKLTIGLSTSIIGVSNSIATLYRVMSKKKILVLGSGSAVGVDSKMFSIPKVKNQSLKVGYAGRIAKDKGIAELLEVFNKLSVIYPRITLEIIGDIDLEDPVDSEVLEVIKNNIQIRWIKHCHRTELARYMKNWTLQIFLSRREGLGNVIIEAAACGVPTICWDVTGVRDAVPDFLSKNLIVYNNIDLVFERIKEFVENPLSEKESGDLSVWAINNFEKNIVLRNFSSHVNNEIFKSGY